MVSNQLHDAVNVGDILDVAPPLGDFFLHEERSGPVVLISAGVGITPMQSMLEHLLQHSSPRSIRFLHACRHGGVHAFRQQLQGWAREYPQLQVQNWYEFPRQQDTAGSDYQHVGRMNLAAVADIAVLADADYYLCGPLPFMQQQKAALLALGVSAERIHAEAFGTGGAGV